MIEQKTARKDQAVHHSLPSMATHDRGEPVLSCITTGR